MKFGTSGATDQTNNAKTCVVRLCRCTLYLVLMGCVVERVIYRTFIMRNTALRGPPMIVLQHAMEEHGVQPFRPNPKFEAALANARSNNKQKPILFTFATHAMPNSKDHFFCETVASAVRAGWDTHVKLLGQIKLDGKFAKVTYSLEFLKRLPPDQMVFFIDAYDVLVMGGPDEAMEKYRQFYERKPLSLLFGGEPACWPFNQGRSKDDKHLEQQICEEHYPPSPTKSRYLNSGMWMGFAGSAIKMLEDAQWIRTIPGLYSNRLGDQASAAYAFLSGNYGIQIDYNYTLLQSAYLSEQDLKYDPSNRRYQNGITNEYPIAVHFNGGSKGEHPKWADRIALTAGRKGRKDFTDLCSNGQNLNNLHGLDFCKICGSLS